MENRFELAYNQDEELRKQAIQELNSAIQVGSSTPSGEPEASYSLGEHLSEVGKGAVSGVMKAVSNTADGLDYVWDKGREHWDLLNSIGVENIPFSDESQYQLPKMQMHTATGKITESMSQFLTGFIPLAKGLKAAGTSVKLLEALQKSQLLRTTVAGAAADFATLDPNEARVATHIKNLAPEVRMPLIDWLASNEPDHEMENRFKNAVEGTSLGVVADLFMHAAKGLKGTIGKKVLPAEAGAADAAIKETIGKPGEINATDAFTVPKTEAQLREETRVATAEQSKAQFDKVMTDPEGPSIALKRLLDGGNDPQQLSALMFNPDHYDSFAGLRKTMELFSNEMPEFLGKLGFKSKQGMIDLAEDSLKYMDSIGVGEVMKKNVDITKLSEHAVATRMMHENVARRVMELGDEIRLTGGSPQQLDLFERNTLILADIQSYAKGTQSEIARALNSYKLFTGAKHIDAETIQYRTGNREAVIRKKAESLAQLANPKDKATFIEKTAKGPTSLDRVQFWWINSLLGGPTTQVVNLVSQAGRAIGMVGETAIAGAMNAVKGGGEISLRTANAQVMGMVAGAIDSIKGVAQGLRATGEMAFTGRVGEDTARRLTEGKTGGFWTSLTLGESKIDPYGFNKSEMAQDMFNDPSKKGVLGSTGRFLTGMIGTPTRVLGAVDEIFKTMHHRGYLYMQADIMANKEGLKGATREQFIKDFLSPENITSKLEKEALKYGKEGTFQSELGGAMRKLQMVTQQQPLLKFAIPFLRTPYNLVRDAVQHSPLMIHPELRKLSYQMSTDMAAGGFKRELAEAKMMSGGMMFMGIATLAYNGVLTPGVGDQFKFDGTGQLINEQKYSVKLGDQRYSLERLDPFGLFIGAVTDLVHISDNMNQREFSETVGSILVSFSNAFVNRTYMQGLADIIDVLTDNDPKKGERWLANFTSSFVPNFMNQTNRMMNDQQVKEIMTFTDHFKKRFYGLSHEVEGKRDVVTGAILNHKQRFMGVSEMSELTDDPVKQEMARIGYKPDKPLKFIEHRIAGIDTKTELDGREYARLQDILYNEAKIDGMSYHQFMKKYQESSWYKGLPDNGELADVLHTKASTSKDVRRRFTQVARVKFIAESDSVRSKLRSDYERQHTQLLNGGS